MHDVQNNLKAMREIKALSDESVIDIVINAWSIVCHENTVQKDLVTAHEFNAWLNFKESQEVSLKKHISEYNGELTKEQSNYFNGLAKTIAQASHMSKKELINRNQKTLENQKAKTTIAPVKTIQEKKKNWMQKLFS